MVDSSTIRVTLTNWGDLAKLAAVVDHGYGREVKETDPKVTPSKANSTFQASRKSTRTQVSSTRRGLDGSCLVPPCRQATTPISNTLLHRPIFHRARAQPRAKTKAKKANSVDFKAVKTGGRVMRMLAAVLVPALLLLSFILGGGLPPMGCTTAAADHTVLNNMATALAGEPCVKHASNM